MTLKPKYGKPWLRSVVAISAIWTAAVPTAIGIDFASAGRAQSVAHAPDMEFEAASIRRDPSWKSGGEGYKRSKIEFSPDSLTMQNVDIGECVQWAYDIPFYQISGLSSANNERYDILAKADGPVPVHQLRLMLQNLLARRFNLALHHETKTLRVYELVAAKGGPKLPPPKTPGEGSTLHTTESLPRVEGGNFVFLDTSMPEFAEKLSLFRGIDLPVIDRTGVKGYFDITLKSAASAMLQPDGPSLFTLIPEQLGLKLVTAKASVDVLVIDHAEKPSEN